MQTRALRVIVVALLLALPAAAASLLWNLDQRRSALVAAEDTLLERFERIRGAVVDIGMAQQSYVAPGQLDEPWFERVSALLQQLDDDAAAVLPLVRSREATDALANVTKSIEALGAADRRTRENLSIGQELMAADVIFSDCRHLLDATLASLRQLHGAERAWYRAEHAAVARDQWSVLGGLALVWVGAIALVFRGKRQPAVATAAPPHADLSKAVSPAPSAAVAPAVDLSAAASLCTSLSRVTDADTLSGLLGRAAAVLDASGLMLWLGAGDQLFAVAGHGYPPDVVARFGPLPRGSDSAVAAAWQTGRLTVVARNGGANGALAAPLFGPERCIGVFAVEIRDGREQDPALQSVAAIVAAQLATAVSAWPAASPARLQPGAARTA